MYNLVRKNCIIVDDSEIDITLEIYQDSSDFSDFEPSESKY